MRYAWKLSCCLFGVLWTLPCVVKAQSTVDVYVLQNNAELTGEETALLSEIVRSQLVEAPSLQHDVSQLISMEEGCDEACIVAEGKAHGARFAVFGTVTKFGSGYAVMLKLTDVSSGTQLASETSDPAPSVDELIAATKAGGTKIADRLTDAAPAPPSPPVEPTPPTPRTEPTPPSSPSPPSPEAPTIQTGTLTVTADPPGATIEISTGVREKIGAAPVTKELYPRDYRVIASYPGRRDAEARVRVDPGEQEKLFLNLKYRANPYKTGGIVALVTGISFVSLGIVGAINGSYYGDLYNETPSLYYENDSRFWTGMMWAGFTSALGGITAAILLWVFSPGDKAYWERKYGGKRAVKPATGGAQ